MEVFLDNDKTLIYGLEDESSLIEWLLYPELKKTLNEDVMLRMLFQTSISRLTLTIYTYLERKQNRALLFNAKTRQVICKMHDNLSTLKQNMVVAWRHGLRLKIPYKHQPAELKRLLLLVTLLSSGSVKRIGRKSMMRFVSSDLIRKLSEIIDFSPILIE